ESAFIENAMAGGDNCARGLALGILLGAANGLSSIPEKWVKNLKAQKKLYMFLEQVSKTSQAEKQTQN
ncbi:MAG: ADP-ribosylglycohydrolase family protein, partial [Opitutales bacterium]|nr:ADP-ribosylglycohydrolase family protein [Opitutales bacterium]